MEPEARTQPPSIEALTAGELPFVLADDHGVVIAINQPFREVYGGGDASLVGASIGQILPESFRMAHQLGFSRFTATEQSTIPGHPLRFKTLCAAGRAVVPSISSWLKRIGRAGSSAPPGHRYPRVVSPTHQWRPAGSRHGSGPRVAPRDQRQRR